MKHKRNAEGLRQNAQKKRQEAFDKVEKGIKQLLKDKTRINFNTVAEASGVSKAWLYKESTIKVRIEHLREQSGQSKKLPRRISASEKSLKAMNETLRARVKKLDAENRDLKRQIEVVYSQVVRVRELEKQIERLTAESQPLLIVDPQPSKATGGIYADLEKLGVKMNSTLEELINGTPEGIVETAIESLKEAQSNGNVANPGGFLNKAIRDCWKPNENMQQEDEMTEFNEWWKWAYRERLVVASQKINDKLHVCTAGEQWITFEEAKRTILN